MKEFPICDDEIEASTDLQEFYEEHSWDGGPVGDICTKIVEFFEENEYVRRHGKFFWDSTPGAYDD